MKDLKSRFLAAIGYVCAADESPAQAFDRLRGETARTPTRSRFRAEASRFWTRAPKS